MVATTPSIFSVDFCLSGLMLPAGSVRTNPEKLAERISEDGELLRDTLFTSPSAASDFLTGSSTSGKVYWKTADGVTLRDLEAAELEAAATGL